MSLLLFVYLLIPYYSRRVYKMELVNRSLFKTNGHTYSLYDILLASSFSLGDHCAKTSLTFTTLAQLLYRMHVQTPYTFSTEHVQKTAWFRNMSVNWYLALYYLSRQHYLLQTWPDRYRQV